MLTEPVYQASQPSPSKAGLDSASPAFSASLQTGSGSPDGVWQQKDESTLNRSLRAVNAASYVVLRLNRELLEDRLAQAPMEFSSSASSDQVLLSLPLPDGSFPTYRIEQSPIMEPELSAQFPEIKTYRGQGVEDQYSTTRFGWTSAGFHAIVFTSHGTVYVDPYSKGDTENYLSYYKRDYQKEEQEFRCLYTDPQEDRSTMSDTPLPAVLNGQTLKTYRLALAATGEYTQFFGGTVAGALAGMTTTMNRVNAIYERDLAARMVLIGSQASIIYTNSATDPYSNFDGVAMLAQNQANLDAVIGTANYDVGHVFSTGGGGIASLGVICSSSNKARGVTGLPSPSGDVFDVDFVSHEMGHQFGGRHTFNGSAGNCSGANRSPSAAYEPGSGSTVQAYAGICGSQNLQSNSDDYFHVRSLEEMLAHINGSGGSCAVQTATGNTIPAVNAGIDYTIPKLTPFTLTASAMDANGDSLTYCWEEYDLGLVSPPDSDSDGNARPIFRSFDPVASPSRTFPKLANILSNTSTIGESLPNITRTMNFQVTVRDNRAGGGAVASDTMQVNVAGSSGPFLITSPNSAVSWASGTVQSITWDVASTNAAPVNCASVKISLSTDGGLTFPITIAASTPNDGSHSFTVPSNLTSSARIKVEAVDSIFFDISNANFSIVAACPASISPLSFSLPAAGGNSNYSVTALAGCNWSATSNNPSFITITSGSGTGNGQVSFSVASNLSSSPRAGSIAIGPFTFPVFQGGAFLDVPESNPFYTDIGKLSARGVTTGCGGGNYCPDALVTREQMAAFIVRALGEFNPPMPVSQRFADVPSSNPFYNFIERMAVLQITLGCGGGNYCPSDTVSREQMAAFMIRALGEFDPPQPAMQRFSDVPPDNPFYKFIDRMAVLGITQGCGSNNYCPSSPVTRAQMAAFLVRAFGL